MTGDFDAFRGELIELCKRHGVHVVGNDFGEIEVCEGSAEMRIEDFTEHKVTPSQFLEDVSKIWPFGRFTTQSGPEGTCAISVEIGESGRQVVCMLNDGMSARDAALTIKRWREYFQ